MEPTTDLEDLASRYRAAVNRLARRTRPTAAFGDLTPTQISVLTTVAVHGPLSSGALTKREGLNATQVSRVLGELEARGLISRTPLESDLRVSIVEVTERGGDLHHCARIERNRAILDHFHCLSPKDLRLLSDSIGALERLVESFEESSAFARTHGEVAR